MLVLLAVLFAVLRSHHQTLDWAALRQELHAVSWPYVWGGIALIYAGYWLRAWRWAILIRPLRAVPPSELLPAQVIGFTAVALVGRVADLARPYLVARRLALPVTGQIAVYSVERAFDLAAAAAVFSLTLAFAPANIPHHEAYVRAGGLSLAGTVLVAGFALALRFGGESVATTLRKLLTPLSPSVARTVYDRLLDLRDGFRTLRSPGQMASAALVSLVMWLGIALSYLAAAHAFVADPTLAHLSFAAIMLVFATSLGGSLLQLPVLAWFTQIAVNAAALHELLGVPLTPATACAAVMLLITNLAILPAGLLAARLQGLSLRSAIGPSAEALTSTPSPLAEGSLK